VEIDGVTLVVSSDPEFAGFGTAPAAAAAAPPSPAPAAAVRHAESVPAALGPAPAEDPANDAPGTGAPGTGAGVDGSAETVTSPTIGLFWRSPKPGAPPFVEVGDAVEAGETLCIIEVMKLMTHVTAPVSGIVSAIHVTNGSMVEHGTALMDVVPADAGQDEQ
jgi:biotin carboxyl carrier protein